MSEGGGRKRKKEREGWEMWQKVAGEGGATPGTGPFHLLVDRKSQNV